MNNVYYDPSCLVKLAGMKFHKGDIEIAIEPNGKVKYKDTILPFHETMKIIAAENNLPNIRARGFVDAEGNKLCDLAQKAYYQDLDANMGFV